MVTRPRNLKPQGSGIANRQKLFYVSGKYIFKNGFKSNQISQSIDFSIYLYILVNSNRLFPINPLVPVAMQGFFTGQTLIIK